MAVALVVLTVLLVVGLARSFIRNARAIRRDMNRRFDDLSARLESDANSLVDGLLDATAHRSDLNR